MASSYGSLNSLPNLPSEASLKLGPLKMRLERLAQPKLEWNPAQDGILYASNRAANVPSYVPRFSKFDGVQPETFTLPTESEIMANLNEKQRNLRFLARPPTYRTRKKFITAQHRITAVSKEWQPRLCYTTPREKDEGTKAKDSEVADMAKIENECMGYAMLAKAKQIVKFRAKQRVSMLAAAAREEPFAVKRMVKFAPHPPNTVRFRNSATKDIDRRKGISTNRTLRNQRIEDKIPNEKMWTAESEWVKYIPTGQIPESVFVQNECDRFEGYLEEGLGRFSPRSSEAFEMEEKYTKTLLSEADPKTQRIFREYKPTFNDAPYKATHEIKKASETYAKRLVAGRIDSKPVEVTWKVV
jgi:hypothetical protein